MIRCVSIQQYNHDKHIIPSKSNVRPVVRPVVRPIVRPNVRPVVRPIVRLVVRPIAGLKHDKRLVHWSGELRYQCYLYNLHNKVMTC